MGLHNTAHYLKSHGRGEDTELVHMTKGEVKGLEDLARAKGGSLSINPSTGLKEAGFLSDILPTVVGAGVGIATANPMLGAAVAGGLGYATSGGNLNRGIMAGLGAYGGAGLYGGLEAAGASALAPQGVEAGNAAVAQAFGGGIDGISSMEEATNLVRAGKLDETAYRQIADTFSQGYSSALGGSSNAFLTGLKTPSAYGQNLAPLSALGIAALGNFGSTSNQSSINPNPNPGYIRPYTFSQTRNPNFGQPGQPYFIQKYTAQPIVPANQWGTTQLPTSGMAAGGLAENEMFPQSQQDSTQFATPTQMPTSSEVIRSDYDPKTDSYTGQENGFADGGNIKDIYIGGQNEPLGFGKFENDQIAAINKTQAPMGAGLVGGLGRAAQAINGPTITPDINGLYQYYLGRQPSAAEAGQWANSINGPVTQDMANYFQQFTGAELANSGYRPQGPNPFAPPPPQVIDQYGPNAYSGGKAGGLMPSDLGSYSDGGRLLKGPGDGVSDSIPAQVGQKQPARLADGEFVVPARIVSELGNGSTDAGARQLYKMMDRIQAKRRKSKAIAANTKAYKDLPA